MVRAQGQHAGVAGTPLVLPTRTRLAYSNYGYAVAGQLVTQVSGVPNAQYLRANVLRPLGLTATDVLEGRATRPGLAVPYGRRTPDGLRTIEQQMPRTDAFDSVGALVSSVSDPPDAEEPRERTEHLTRHGGPDRAPLG